MIELKKRWFSTTLQTISQSATHQNFTRAWKRMKNKKEWNPTSTTITIISLSTRQCPIPIKRKQSISTKLPKLNLKLSKNLIRRPRTLLNRISQRLLINHLPILCRAYRKATFSSLKENHTKDKRAVQILNPLAMNVYLKMKEII
jgi:hypothetical protein